jgi:hypothetical protein
MLLTSRPQWRALLASIALTSLTSLYGCSSCGSSMQEAKDDPNCEMPEPPLPEELVAAETTASPGRLLFDDFWKPKTLLALRSGLDALHAGRSLSEGWTDKQKQDFCAGVQKTIDCYAIKDTWTSSGTCECPCSESTGCDLDAPDMTMACVVDYYKDALNEAGLCTESNQIINRCRPSQCSGRP